MQNRRLATLLFSVFMVLSADALAKKIAAADYVDPVTGMEFMAIPGGIFTMGHSDEDNSLPLHEVSVQPFLIGRHEVTFAQYQKFTAGTGRAVPDDNGWGKDDRPVINVSWHDAVAFTEWLSVETGQSFRLPSEAEWEYAALGGQSYAFSWGNDLGENQANCHGCGSQWDNTSTAPVGSFSANGYGLYDMVGNVYEYTLDAHHQNYEGAPSDGSAWLEPTTILVISRSGSYKTAPGDLAITDRCWVSRDNGYKDHGFRVVLEP